MKAIVFGACTDLGCHIDGARWGADALAETAEKDGTECRMIYPSPSIIKSTDPQDHRKNEAEINHFNEQLYHQVRKGIEGNRFPITVGGDHAAAIGSALAAKEENNDLGIIWIDAHTDYNTPESTITGNVHGFPLACITGYDCADFRIFFHGTCYDRKRTVVIGARSIDEQEAVNVKDAGIKVFTMPDIHRLGMQQVMQEAFQIAGSDHGQIHVSYDIDAIDSTLAPGVSTPVANGLTLEEAQQTNTYFMQHIDQISSYDLVEFNPDYDQNGKTKAIADRLLLDLLHAVSSKH
jgi:arginase